MFPTLDTVGWYTTGSDPAQYLDIHHQFAALVENPLLLCLDPSGPCARGLPVAIFEPILDLQNNQISFSSLDYKIETGEAERIAIEHVVHSTNVGSDENAACKTLRTCRRV